MKACLTFLSVTWRRRQNTLLFMRFADDNQLGKGSSWRLRAGLPPGGTQTVWRNGLTAASWNTIRTNAKPCPSKAEPCSHEASIGKQLWGIGPGHWRAGSWARTTCVSGQQQGPTVPTVTWAGHSPESQGRAGTVTSAWCLSDPTWVLPPVWVPDTETPTKWWEMRRGH